MIKHNTVTVAITATSLLTGAERDSHGYSDVSRTLLVSNPSSVSVFVGGPGVTTTDYGYELKTGTSLSLDLGVYDEPFAVAADQGLNPQPTVNVLHTGV